jgi:hypothetical protein
VLPTVAADGSSYGIGGRRETTIKVCRLKIVQIWFDELYIQQSTEALATTVYGMYVSDY